MKEHLTKHKTKYGFVAAVGLASFSFNALVQPLPEKTDPTAPLTLSQRQELAAEKSALAKQKCREWITDSKRQEAFGEGYSLVGGQYHASTGTVALSCVLREKSSSAMLTFRGFEDAERTVSLFETTSVPTTTAESVDIGDAAFWLPSQQQLLVRNGGELYTLRFSPATQTEAIIEIGKTLFKP